MESTGVYWIPLYEILEERGFKVCLVNARYLKNVSGLDFAKFFKFWTGFDLQNYAT
jgi:transposase